MSEFSAQIDRWLARLGPLVAEAMEIWRSGGWAMAGIAAIGMVMFGLGVSVWLRLRGKRFRAVPESRWRRWIDHPAERRGPIGELMDYALDTADVPEMSTAFEELRKREIAPFTRDLKVMRICVSAAPLVGLLGTVTGMLATFAALSSGAGGEKTMDLVAEGISTALVTTETGLVVALPGLFFQYQLKRKHDQYAAFLSHLENACLQWRYRRQTPRARAA